ncbi:hypothetical protein AB4401_14130 [Vibrio cyclitrophicus]|uniref:hypothetical protein n=1 Tax=Vibrio cyclitrophicus TaxID=47951 RepID=UPI0002E4909C|nr:hypothetical protein [Vibrio cyclitrophicus]OED80071.1 hypothetical protein OAS_04805 [Vibrio cyclitrophicus ZF65]
MRSVLSASLFVFATLILGCTTNKQIRVDGEDCSYHIDEHCEDNYIISDSSSGPNGYNYTLSFVEFDEQGHFQDRDQLNNVIEHVNKQGDGQDIILFIHGWHHGVEDKDSNVVDFRKALRKLSKRNKTRTVTGIYVGWRGDSISIPIVNKTTFWDRKQVSIEIGQGAATELINRLEHISKDKDKTRLIAIGHSFGGSVLFSATKNKFYNDLLKRFNYEKSEEKSVLNKEHYFRDIYILVNPAIENIQYAPLNDLVNEMSAEYPDIFLPSSPPNLTVFMSEGDWATGIVFPIGRFFGTLLENQNPIVRENRFGQEVSYSQFSMDLKALGHYEPFITHSLISVANGNDTSFCQGEPKMLDIPIVDAGSQDTKSNYNGRSENWTMNFTSSKTKLSHLGNSPAFSPIWVVKTDKQVISDHNAIFGDQFSCYLEELMLVNKP